MKKLLKIPLQNLARSLGYQITKRRETSVPLDIFRDILLAHAPPAAPGFFFVQIGANDGVSYDSVRPYVIEYGWRGVLVEPQPKPFARLVKNYEGIGSVGNVSFVNAAIATTRGKLPFFANDDDLLGGFSESVTRGNALAGSVKQIEVDAMTFDDLVTQENISRIDLLVIDTEGYDLQILKTIDFTRVLPRVIRYEICNLTDAEFAESEALLARHGYRFFLMGIDAIAALEPAARASAGGA
jgi:FkbM family methyltransferase